MRSLAGMLPASREYSSHHEGEGGLGLDQRRGG